MAAHDDPTELRRRASVLRRLATQLDGSTVRRLPRLADDDTWCGPTATAFRTDTEAAWRGLTRAVESLQRAAARLEREADAAAARLLSGTIR